MVKCIALHCKNSTDLGVRMCRFPTNSARRQNWIENSKIYNHPEKQVLKEKFFCEYHFEPDQWEKVRVDGTKKLKPNAVPTIFDDTVQQVSKLTVNKECSSSTKKNESVPCSSTLVENINLVAEEPRKKLKCERDVITGVRAGAQSLECDAVPRVCGNIVYQAPNLTVNNECTSATKQTENISYSSTMQENMISLAEQLRDQNVSSESDTIVYEASKPYIKSIEVVEPPETELGVPELQLIVAGRAPQFETGPPETIVTPGLTTDSPAGNLETLVDVWKNKFLETEKKLTAAKNKLQDVERKSQEIKIKCKRAEKIIHRGELLRMQMKRTLTAKSQQFKRKIQKLETQNHKLMEHLHEVFNPDQLKLLTNRYKKMPEWCNATLVKAFRLKFACGTKGYEEIIESGIPLPSVRTLQRQLQDWAFKPGILEDVFEFLNTKIATFREQDKDCLLILDEVAITPGEKYDQATGSYLGYVTVTNSPNTSEIANSGLVFMLAGISARWKQPVAFHLTSKSTDGALYYPMIIELIEKCESIGLKPRGVVSNMAGANQGLWSLFGISASRFSVPRNKCTNPVQKERNLYFFHDPAHGWKNFKEGFSNHKIIIIPKYFVDKYQLPTTQATFAHFQELVNIQSNSEFLLAPGITEEMLSPGHFRKMRVENTSRVLSHDVCAALHFLSEAQNRPELRTTAWLVSVLSRWWRIVSCRNLSLALSEKNEKVYKDTLNFLEEFILLVCGLLIGAKGGQKPFQTGLIISTRSLIDLTKELLKEDYSFVVPGRFSQDCLENMFSALRVKNVVMNALQFKNNLKSISVALYMKHPRGSSYAEDDRNFLLDCLSHLKEKKRASLDQSKENVVFPVSVPEIPLIITSLNEIDKNILHNIAGYLITSIIKKHKVCENCITRLGRFTPCDPRVSRLSSLKAYKKETLFFVNNATFNFFSRMECIFCSFFPHVCNIENLNLHAFFTQKFSEDVFELPECHKLRSIIIKRFATFRLKIKSRKLKKSGQYFASKSMAMTYGSK